MEFSNIRLWIIVLCTSGIKDFVYQRAEGELIRMDINTWVPDLWKKLL